MKFSNAFQDFQRFHIHALFRVYIYSKLVSSFHCQCLEELCITFRLGTSFDIINHKHEKKERKKLLHHFNCIEISALETWLILHE